LVYEHKVDESIVVVFKDGKYDNVPEKRITLDKTMDVLYPVGYNLDQLFTSFKSRKLEKDIKKGRFKNMRDLKERISSLNES